MSAIELAAIEQTMEFSEVAAWGLIVAVLVYGASVTRLREGAVALAALAALVTKAMLLPLT